ncbi:MAG: ABC transporter permease subunit [Lachnospiraceae bacterium]|nr:ABC transporter permease subunit [Lachnospiraceae bacterium]
MKRLLSSLSYQLLRDGAMVRITLLLAAGLAVFGFVLGLSAEEEACAGRLIVDSPPILWMFQSMLMAILAAVICTADFRDKVIYQELMAGHSRAEIFFSRAIPATLLTAAVATLLSFMPVLSNCLIFGWGDVLEPAGALLRIALFFFPFLRMAAFFVLVAFLCKKSAVVIVSGYIIMTLGLFLENVSPDHPGFLLGFYNLQDLCDFSTWSIYNLDQEGGILTFTAYDSSISAGMIAGTVLVSLLVSAVYLMAGYGFFRRDDMN